MTFPGEAGFYRAKFVERPGFHEVTFSGDAWFDETEFAGGAEFGTATFNEDTYFDKARVTPSFFRVVLPRGWITRAAQPVEGEEEGWLYVVRDENLSEQPTESSNDEGVRAACGKRLEHEA